MKVVSDSSRKYATIFKIMMETGITPYKRSRLSLRDIDLEKRTIAVRGYKEHISRVFKLKSDTAAMLKEYVQTHNLDRLLPDSIYISKLCARRLNLSKNNKIQVLAKFGYLYVLPLRLSQVR